MHHLFHTLLWKAYQKLTQLPLLESPRDNVQPRVKPSSPGECSEPRGLILPAALDARNDSKLPMLSVLPSKVTSLQVL